MQKIGNKELIEKLEKHLKEVEFGATDLYKSRLTVTISKLKVNGYEDEDLIRDLQSLGFQDVAREIRKGMFI